MRGAAKQLPLGSLLDPELPPGMLYIPRLLDEAGQQKLQRFAAAASYSEVRMHGVAARRRVAHFGLRYAFESFRLEPAAAIPNELMGLRDQVAQLAAVPPEELVEALITWYPPGAGIGWHQDAPAFGNTVIGVSLGAECTIRLRPTGSTARGLVRVIKLDPGSCYVIARQARSSWQHQIPPVHKERWSITFRTLAGGRSPPKSQ